MSIVILGIDLGKNSCSIVGRDANGSVVVRRRMRRDGVIAFASKLPPCVMAMDACCGAHHMGRSLAAMGHDVRLMSPEYVSPYVKAHKNGDRDAEAIAEAAEMLSPRSMRRSVSGAHSCASLRRRNVSETYVPLRRTRARQLPDGSF